jgi:hypothetical protein
VTARLVEAGTVNNAVNRLWGEVDGKGENMLGVMLMELRTAYAKDKSAATKCRRRSPKSSKASANSKGSLPSEQARPHDWRLERGFSGQSLRR